MFTPFTLRGVTLKNRVVVSPMAQYSAVDGIAGDYHLMHLGARAQGGAALVLTEMTCVSPEGAHHAGLPGLYNDEQRDAWRRIVDFVHRQTRREDRHSARARGRQRHRRAGVGRHRPAA